MLTGFQRFLWARPKLRHHYILFIESLASVAKHWHDRVNNYYLTLNNKFFEEAVGSERYEVLGEHLIKSSQKGTEN